MFQAIGKNFKISPFKNCLVEFQMYSYDFGEYGKQRKTGLATQTTTGLTGTRLASPHNYLFKWEGTVRL